ncbi:MAG: YjbQ family protein [Nitrospiraceae bacterium]|jgi:secondary thiamine-phosphate synthase enzyme|nr:YjbQ family protein [Nitrospiraceae bacterium]
MTRTIAVKSRTRNELIDITAEVSDLIRASGTQSGTCTLFVTHTTAGITINEGADPSVRRDILTALSRVFPEHGDYRHAEGNSDSHIKASLMGSSVTVLIEDGKPLLGTWQAIYFCEFDGPRSRTVLCRIA